MSEYIKQNFTKGQTLKADHMNHIEDGIASVAERTKGMPYVEKTEGVFIWDGDPTGMEVATSQQLGWNFVKVSDKPITVDNIVEKRVSMFIGGEIQEAVISEDILEDYHVDDNNYMFSDMTSFVSVFGDVSSTGVFPLTEGLWFLYGEIKGQLAYTVSVECFTVPTETIHPLDEKFLPESVDGVIIRSSTEGSTKKFKVTVNDEGTLTAIEV